LGRERLGKLTKSNLGSEERGESEEDVERIDFFASDKGIFEEDASERAILCLITSGHSCDVAR